MEKNATEDKKTQEIAPQAPKPDKKPFTTFGQSAHKWGTYLSIDWGWNYISGMGFSALARYTKIGQRWWAEPVTDLSGWIAKNIMRAGEEGFLKSRNACVAFISVIAGGTLFTIPPLTLLEDKDRRRSIVKWLDEKHYGKDVVAEDPRFVEAYDAMDHEPKKGFWVGQLSRIASLAPLLWTVMADKPRDATQPYFDWVGNGSAKIYEKAGLTKDRLFKNFSPAEREKEWKWLHETSSIDFGLEPWYAVLHMITFRTFAKWFGKSDLQHPPHGPLADRVRIPLDPPNTERIRTETEPEVGKPSPQINQARLEAQLAASPELQIATN